MSLRKDIAASYVGTGAAALVPILALPWYLHALGPKLWGLVSFVSLLQSLMIVIDAGFAQALIREFALRNPAHTGTSRPIALLLIGFERVYWLAGLAPAITIAALSPLIATKWLNLDGVDQQTAAFAIIAGAIITMAQLPGSVYRSALVGCQHQVTINAIMASTTLVRHAGAVALMVIWPSIYVYLAWQTTTALLDTMARAYFAWKAISVRRRNVHFDFSEARNALPLALRMSGAVMLGAIAMQMDKVVLSRLVSIEAFGYYAIASSVAMSTLQLVAPLAQVATPKIVRLSSQQALLAQFNRKLFGAILFIVACVAVGYLSVGRELIAMWLHNPTAVAAVFPVLSILLIGSALNALGEVGYANWNARGAAHFIALRNMSALLFAVAVMPIMVWRYGLLGAATSWVFLGSFVFLASLRSLFRTKTTSGIEFQA